MFLSRTIARTLRPRVVAFAPANTMSFATDNKYGSSSTNTGVDVYIGNLDTTVTADALKQAITGRYAAEFGGPRIVFNKVERKSMGFGYITVPTAEAATAAIAALKGLVLADKELKIDMGQERRVLRGAFFGNLSQDISEEDLMAHIDTTLGSAEGESVVEKIRLARNTDGTTRGFAHIDFRDAASRDRALLELNGVELKGRALKVDKAALKTKLPVVYIGNISYDVTAAHLEQMLDEVVGGGNYSDIKLHVDRVTGYPRGFAHVTFASRQVGNKAITELNGIEMMGRPLRANFATKRTDAAKIGSSEGNNSDQ